MPRSVVAPKKRRASHVKKRRTRGSKPPPAPRTPADLATSPKLQKQILADGWLKQTEAAAFLGCSPKHVFDLQRRGKLAWGRLGRGRMVPRLAMIELMRGNEGAGIISWPHDE